MSQFKVGPAKCRDGQECFIIDIMPDGRLAIRVAYTGKWYAETRESNGYFCQRQEAKCDVLPNVEPEWGSYTAFQPREGHPRLLWCGDGETIGCTADEVITLLYAPGHPIQIISGDFVDAREKDE